MKRLPKTIAASATATGIMLSPMLMATTVAQTEPETPPSATEVADNTSGEDTQTGTEDNTPPTNENEQTDTEFSFSGDVVIVPGESVTKTVIEGDLGDEFTLEKVDGPEWVSVNEDNTVSFTPSKETDLDYYTYTLQVKNSQGSVVEQFSGTAHVANVSDGEGNEPEPTMAATIELDFSGNFTVQQGLTHVMEPFVDKEGNPLPEGTTFSVTPEDMWIQFSTEGNLVAAPPEDTEAGDYDYSIAVHFPDGSTADYHGVATVEEFDFGNVEEGDENTTPAEDTDDPVIEQPDTQTAGMLASTGASILALVGIAAAALVAGLGTLFFRRKNNESDTDI